MAEVYGVNRCQSIITVNVGSELSRPGTFLLLAPEGEWLTLSRVITVLSPLPFLTAGMQLESLEHGLLQVRWLTWLPEPGKPARRAAWVKVLETLPTGASQFRVRKYGTSLAWITLSDKVSAGARVDTSGPSIESLVDKQLELAYAVGFVLPDEELALRGLLVQLALEQGFDLVLTTGGTGIAPRDTTPEAVLAVIEKRVPGFERAITTAGLIKTPHAMLSRAVVGTLGRTLIVTLPGSPTALAETLAAILPAIPHSLAKLQGNLDDCGILRAE